MGQPTAYNRLKDFTQYALDHTSAPYNASDHDAELDAIELTLDGLCANIELIQRNDGKLRNQTVHPDSLTTATKALIGAGRGNSGGAAWTPRGLWATTTEYDVGDVVEEGGRSYVCAEDHTSGTFSTDRTAGKWVIIDSTDGSVSYFAAATGTGDAMVVALPITGLSDGFEFRTRAPGANTVTNPTVTVGGSTVTITKHGGGALTAGDYATGSELTLRYRESTTKFELVAYKAASLAELAASGGSALIGHTASGSGATATNLQTRGRLVIYPQDFGATGNGTTDDTTAIDAASTACRAAEATLYFPPGDYVYDGGGIYGHPVRGAGAFVTTISLGSGKSLVVSPPGPALTGSLDVTDITASGGFGLVRLTYTGANSSASAHRVERFRSLGQSGPAISSLSSDHPYWKIKGLISYTSGGPAGSMGVALAGNTDACDIDVDVIGPAIGVKLGNSGANARVTGSFVRNAAYSSFPRVALWLVPKSTSTNAGNGLVVNKFRFGNENKDQDNDYHILVADEDSAVGSDFSDHTPKLSADSTGYSIGVGVTDCLFFDSGSAPGGPCVYTTTPNLRAWHVGPITITAAAPNYIIQYRTVPTPDELATTNVIGPVLQEGRSALATTALPSNAKGSYVLVDADEQFSRFSETLIAHPGGNNPAGYVQFLKNTAGLTLNGTTTSAAATDAIGESDALEITYASNAVGNSASVTMSSANVVAGRPIWVEIDLKSGSSSSLTDIELRVRYSNNTAIFWRAYIPVPSEWTTYRFSFVPPAAASNLQFLVLPHAEASGGKVKIGRPHVYHAREPIARGHFLQGGTSGTFLPAVLKASAVTTNVGNVGTGEDDLMTYSLPANSMNLNGRGVKITAWGTTANNSNTKSVKLYFGSVAILTTALTVSQAGVWRATATVLRTGSNAQDYSSQLVQGGTTTLLDAESGTLTQTDTAAITIKCTGTVADGGGGVNNDDIVQEGLLVEQLN